MERRLFSAGELRAAKLLARQSLCWNADVAALLLRHLFGFALPARHQLRFGFQPMLKVTALRAAALHKNFVSTLRNFLLSRFRFLFCQFLGHNVSSFLLKF